VIELSKQTNALSGDELFTLTAKVYLKAKKTRGTFTRDINNLVDMDSPMVIEKDGKLAPNIKLIADRLPFSL
jgi:hypothetical protein